VLAHSAVGPRTSGVRGHRGRGTLAARIMLGPRTQCGSYAALLLLPWVVRVSVRGRTPLDS
jgi:hypothetical protein